MQNDNSNNKQNQPGSLRNIQVDYEIKEKTEMDNDSEAKSIISIQPHDKLEPSFINKVKGVLGKASQSTFTIVMVGGLVAVISLWIIGSSDCGGSLNFKLSLSINEFQLKKEACPPNK